MSHFRAVPALLLLAALTACPKDKAGAPDASTPAAAAPIDAGHQPAAVIAASRVAVRQSADEKGRAVTLMSYGERVTVLESGDPFTRVQLSDGETGFIPTRYLILGDAQPATLVADQDLYARPDALSPVRKRVPPGELVFILQDKGGWRQIHLPERAQGWVPRDKASTDEMEVAAARALYRADALLDGKKPEQASRVLEEFLSTFSQARLAPVVEARLRAIPVPDAGPPPEPDAGPAAAAPAVPAPAPAAPVTPAVDAAVPPSQPMAPPAPGATP